MKKALMIARLMKLACIAPFIVLPLYCFFAGNPGETIGDYIYEGLDSIWTTFEIHYNNYWEYWKMLAALYCIMYLVVFEIKRTLKVQQKERGRRRMESYRNGTSDFCTDAEREFPNLSPGERAQKLLERLDEEGVLEEYLEL